MRNSKRWKLCLLIVLVIMAACSNVTGNDPNVVLQEFFEHLAKKDIDGASKYVTSDSKPTMQMMKKGLDMAEKVKDSALQNNDPMKEFEDVVIEPARVMGDSALITVKSKTNKRPAAEFKLIKQSNGWKVDFTMNTLMRMGAKAAGETSSSDLTDIGSIDSSDMKKGMEMADSILKNMDPKMLENIQKKLENLK
ncbi:MAG TPA: DUF4878 domain-containing protein [Niabella sp.]|nr:DUF4878 domain-containing protein [Niabella sp.]